jgi:putative N6-adenine-specific DNA methylase
MFEYQKNNRFFAQVTTLMEEMAAQELQELGAVNTEVTYRGVYFEADKKALYRINYNSRLLSRVLAPLLTFPAYTTGALTKTAYNINWESIFNTDQTFSISASVAKSKITNSLYASQCLKDGIADRFRDKTGKRPSVNTVNPDIRLNLHIETDMAILSLDTSGESLHKRGYRLMGGEAPMQETVAAAIIRLSGWDGEKPMLDPMCGSGTLLCEALMHYCRIPAQYLRTKFGFTHLPDFERKLWKEVKDESDSRIRPLPEGLINGSDISQRVIETAKANLSRLPYHDKVVIKGIPFQHIKEFENGVIITNPPYGIRLGKPEEVQELFKAFGDFIKQSCKGTSAFIYAGDPSLRKHIGLRTSRRIPLSNGKFEGVLLQIDSYEGTKKKKYREKED